MDQIEATPNESPTIEPTHRERQEYVTPVLERHDWKIQIGTDISIR